METIEISEVRDRTERNPKTVIDLVFDRLTVRYGVAFMRQYEGIEPKFVKEDWRRVLMPFAGSIEAIKAALEDLPLHPPHATSFAALCASKRLPEVFEPLPSPKADPARVAAELQKINAPKPLKTDSEGWEVRNDCKDWARKILWCHDHKSGEDQHTHRQQPQQRHR